MSTINEFCLYPHKFEIDQTSTKYSDAKTLFKRYKCSLLNQLPKKPAYTKHDLMASTNDPQRIFERDTLVDFVRKSSIHPVNNQQVDKILSNPRALRSYISTVDKIHGSIKDIPKKPTTSRARTNSFNDPSSDCMIM